MSDTPDEPPFVTRKSLSAVFVLLSAAVTVIALSDRPAAAPPEAPDILRPLVFQERPDGGLDVRDAGGALVDRLEVQGDLFAITAIRGVAGRVGAEPGVAGYALEVRRTGDTVHLFDPKTGRRLTLEGFGIDNRAALGRYLAAGG